MFLDHFGLRGQPFGVTLDPRFLYFSPSHDEALASLFYGIQTQRNVVDARIVNEVLQDPDVQILASDGAT